MNSKKLLALLLAATLLTGSLCGPVFAARAGQTAGAEFLEEIPPETIFTEKTDASAEGEAAGEYSTALETAYCSGDGLRRACRDSGSGSS